MRKANTRTTTTGETGAKMVSVERARQLANDLISTSDPHRPIMVMLSPFKLACLMIHLATYVAVMGDEANYTEFMRTLNEIDNDVQKVVAQVLQQESPQS